MEVTPSIDLLTIQGAKSATSNRGGKKTLDLASRMQVTKYLPVFIVGECLVPETRHKGQERKP